jgi:hypothetical protein
LSDNEKRWEKIIPNFDKKIISDFPSGGFASALDSNGSVVFLGGDNINLMNNKSYIYDPKINNVSISLNGTNDSVNFCDKNFYKFNKKYSIALPKDIEEVKEILMIDKDEQSLIKTHIDLSKNDNFDLDFSQREYAFPKTKIRSNMIIANRVSMSKANYRNINPNMQIKEEPKEFGYYISSNSSEQVRIKAQKDRIKMVQISPNHVPYKIGKVIETKNENGKESQRNSINNDNINRQKEPEIDNKVNLVETQNQEIKEDDIQKIINILVFDGKIEPIFPLNIDNKYLGNKYALLLDKGNPEQELIRYRKMKESKSNNIYEYLPCFVCTSFKECKKDNVVNPMECPFNKALFKHIEEFN